MEDKSRGYIDEVLEEVEKRDIKPYEINKIGKELEELANFKESKDMEKE